MEAGREIFWNIGAWGNLVYVLSALALGVFAWGFYTRYLLWRKGRPENRTSDLPKRVSSFLSKILVEVLGHRQTLKEPFPGLLHFILFWDVAGLFAASLADLIHHYFFPFLKGEIYLWFSLIVDILGLLGLVAVLAFSFRRYIQKPAGLDNRASDAIALTIIFLLIFSGFLVEATRLAATEMIATPESAPWSFGGWIFGKALIHLGAPSNRILHSVFWFLHLTVAIGTLVYVALTFSKLMHIVVAPVNIFFRSLRPRGQLLPIDFDTATDFGVSRVKDFTWKQLLDLDACIRCGRCQESCPAHLSGKVLSPKKIIQNLKAEMAKGWSFFRQTDEEKDGESGASAPLLLENVICSEAIWDCTTCGACMEVCPVYVEHIDKIVDMRRGQILNDRGMPKSIRESLRNMEIRGHPWRGSEYVRGEWAKDLKIKILSDHHGPEVDWLYWVGCTGSLVERNILVSRAFSRLLEVAGINFGILGNNEGCCGDPARRMGHELQFQMIAQQNIEVMKGHGVGKIVTQCPHCYNTLKNEYPQFGGDFEVWHHSVFLESLVRGSGKRLTPGKLKKKVTYHDPCYLGRYNRILDPPRNLLQSITGISLLEMKQRGEQSFCCGAGGGHAWMEEPVGQKINLMRMEQAMGTAAECIAVACPFCMQMMEDAKTSLQSPLEVMDVTEIIAASLSPQDV